MPSCRALRAENAARLEEMKQEASTQFGAFPATSKTSMDESIW
jgi:hypothetical protein